MARPATTTALSMRGLVKTFGAVRALDGANFEVERGEVHGLVGQNGAGKSTVIKILAGLFKPDAGTIEIDGRLQTHVTPHAVEAQGVHIIHQDRLLVPTFTVGEALFLGREVGFGGLPLLNRREMQRRARDVIRRYFGVELPGDALIGELTTAQQKIVQITHALLGKASLLVLDEPTAALVKREVDSLFAVIRSLRASGISVVYISHYMQEIEAICDRVTVLRNGRDVGVVETRTTQISTIVSMMIARDLQEMFPKRAVAKGPSVLSIRKLGLADAFSDVSLDVHQGEVVGITGLLGSGAKELLQCVFGLKRPDTGEILVEGRAGRFDSPSAAVRQGLAMVPEDRRAHGVAMGLSVRENTTIASLSRYSRGGFLRHRAECAAVDELIGTLAIRTDGRDALVRQLSGGNQQKVVLAKWLSRRSKVFVLDEPTVAVDVGAKVEIYHLLNRLAGEGAGILMLSTELMELIGVCDRILVMYRGRIVDTFDAASTNDDELLASATGARSAASAARREGALNPMGDARP
jgi:ribose transport system ATP-binding protein